MDGTIFNIEIFMLVKIFRHYAEFLASCTVCAGNEKQKLWTENFSLNSKNLESGA